MFSATTKIRELPDTDVIGRVNILDWSRFSDELDAQGYTVIEKLVFTEECDALVGLYPKDENFAAGS
jgi:hypothetical protein